MRLERLDFRHYGPLNKSLELDEGINVIKGPNESGKTLLVEALLRRLSEDAVSDPVVEDDPSGFVTVVDGGDEVKLDGDDEFCDFCEDQYGTSIEPQELRNIFVIRSGDLFFNNQDDFYSHITDKLTGRRVEDINTIKERLLDAGRLTERRHNISSSSSYNDAGNQLETAKELQDDIQDYLDTAESEKAAQLESKLLRKRQRRDELDTKVSQLEEAEDEKEKLERYRNLREKVETIKQNLEELDELPEESALEDLKGELDELRDETARRDTLIEERDAKRRIANLALGGGVVTAIGGFALGAGVFSILAGLGPAAAAVYFWRQAEQRTEQLGDLDARAEELLDSARAIGLEVEDLDDIPEEIESAQQEIDALSDANTEAIGALKDRLDVNGTDTKDILEQAQSLLEEQEDEIDTDLAEEFDEAASEDAREELDGLDDEIKSLEQELDAHLDKLDGFQNRADELHFDAFTGSPLSIQVRNLDGLEQLRDKLKGFIKTIEEDAEASRRALEIFERIQEDEQEETAELFEEGSRATELFARITGDRYSSVSYDSEDNQLIVEKATGETLTPEQLSDGTRDQLYLAIRVALGEQVLDGTPGFFVMDDAFLTSDSTRIQEQAELVKGLAEDGWQVVYLSSKDDAIDALGDYSEFECELLHALE